MEFVEFYFKQKFKKVLNMKKISLLGSTGSIGTQTLDVIDHLGFEVVAMSAFRNIKLLEQQVRKFKPKLVCIFDESLFSELKTNLADCSVKVVSKMEGLCEIANQNSANLVFNAIVGTCGLLPTIAALKNKKDVAMANKESIVVAGELLFDLAERNSCKILPVDSEHSAIFQCIEQQNFNEVSKLILTASGGPFFGKTREDLKNVKISEALNHPNWKMGKKISIDSATLINKGFELIEACYFFKKKPSEIEIIIHPQSLLHSAVSYVDGTVIGQFGKADMRLPIQFALTYPKRVESLVRPFSFVDCKNLSFFKPDYETFGCLKLCVDAIKVGGFAPAIIHAANEQAVELFLDGKIGFLQIEQLIKNAMQMEIKENIFNFDSIIEIIEMVKNYVYETSKKIN